ncbi:MAG: ABC transporter substrate-binding protein [Thermoplasmata archaeon]|nr:ABC transporter substrate-binding protein [Thermoplasmata archaeon]
MKGKNNNHGKVVGLALLFTLMMVLSSLPVSASTAGTRQSSELILRVAMQDDMKGTNPLTASDVWTWNVLGYLFDGPIGVNPTTDELIPYIAVGSANTSTALDVVDWSDCDVGVFANTPKETWGLEVQGSNIGESIIFYDFEDVIWHDGVQMDIRDIMFSMHMAGQVPEWSSSMNPLKDNGGGTGSNYSSTSWLHVYKVWESTDHMQAALKFVLREPYADFFRSTLSTFLLPEHIWAYKISGQNVDGTKLWFDPGYNLLADDSWKSGPAQAYENNPPIGNGPFKFVSWEPGQISKISTWREHFFNANYKYTSYVLDEYGDTLAIQPTIDAVTFKIYKTAEAAVLALKAGDIDYIAWSVPPTFVQELANEPGVALQQSPEQGFFYLAYNMRKTSFGYKDGDPAKGDVAKPLRKAIAHCIDKNRIVTRLLLNLGIGGEGPVSSISSWYNKTIPTYKFDPDEAKNILASYKVDNKYYYAVDKGGSLLTGDAAKAAAGPGNWWVHADGTGGIGSSAGGLIEILTPEANYDPIRAQAGLMIAQQLRDIGIYAESVAMDFGSIVDRIDNRDFDMYILGWRIGSDPTDFLHAFFHSSAITVGQNYPGYQNYSFDAVIDQARKTGDEEERKQLVFEAQAAICYDLPYDVLYFRTNIEAYRSDRFTGWEVGSTGSIYNWNSLRNIRAPSLFKTNAQFVSPPSAIVSNSTDTKIDVFVKDQNGDAISGAQVWLNASIGSLAAEIGNTTSTGKFTTMYTAPYVDPNDQDAVRNGTPVIIQIKEARYTSADGTEYDPASSRLTLIKVFPVGAEFLSVSLEVDPDVIDPDIGPDGTLGFTYVEVLVTNQNGDPVSGSSVALSVSPDVPTITPAEQLTDADGKAQFKVTADDLPANDGSIVEYALTATAIHPTDTSIRGVNSINLNIVDTLIEDGGGGGTPFPSFLVVASVFCIASVSYAVIRKIKK